MGRQKAQIETESGLIEIERRSVEGKSRIAIILDGVDDFLLNRKEARFFADQLKIMSK